MNDFFSAINSYGRFTSANLAAIAAIVNEKTWPAGSTVLQIGEIANAIYFVRSGALHSSYYTEEQLQVVQGLFLAGDWMLEHKSFTSRAPATNAIEAFTDCVLLELPIEGLHELIESSPVFFQLGSVLQIATARQELLDAYPSPDDRYREILQQRPELLQHFPLKLIASYLRMTPETLSRVRKRCASN